MSGLTEIPYGIVAAANQRLWGELGSDARMVADALITRPGFAESMAEFARTKLSLRASLKTARKIMGANFFGPKEAHTAFGLAYGDQERFELDIIPFQPSTLERCKETHALVAVFPLSLIELRECVREEKLFVDQNWSSMKTIVSSKGKATWHLVRKSCVPDSSNKDLTAQRSLLSKHEMVPTARTVTYLAAVDFQLRRERLFELSAVRCSEFQTGKHSCVGFSANHIGVSVVEDSLKTPFLGLASEELYDRSAGS